MGFFQQLQARIQATGTLLVVGLVFGLRVQQLVGNLLETLVAQKRAAEHEQRRDDPGKDGAQEQGGRHHDELVHRRPFEHGPYDREFTLSPHTGYLLRIEGQVVTQNARRFLRRNLGHDRHVVEQRGNVIKKRQQAGAGHRAFRIGSRQIAKDTSVNAGRLVSTCSGSARAAMMCCYQFVRRTRQHWRCGISIFPGSSP